MKQTPKERVDEVIAENQDTIKYNDIAKKLGVTPAKILIANALFLTGVTV